MSKVKILVMGDEMYGRPFEEHGDVTYISPYDHYVENLVEGYDVVLFTGGEDVSPSYYGEEAHPTTQFNARRDEVERVIYEDCLLHGIKMCGICRGSQFLTVMNGGKLVQHIEGHGIYGTHEIDNYREHVGVTSTHHQMMYPWGLTFGEDFEMLAAAPGTVAEGLPSNHSEINDNVVGAVVEAVHYPKTDCLCVQFHPEYMPVDSDGYQYYQALLNEYVFND